MPVPISMAAARGIFRAGLNTARSAGKRRALGGGYRLRGEWGFGVDIDVRPWGHGFRHFALQAKGLPGVLILQIDPTKEIYDHVIGPKGKRKPRRTIDIVMANEFGTKTIPARPALSTAIARNNNTWLRSMIARASRVMRDLDDQKATMNKLGKTVLLDIRTEYEAWRSPPNADGYLAFKKRHGGGSEPLKDYSNDTGVRLREAFHTVWIGTPEAIAKEMNALDRQGRWLITNGRVKTI